jgi:hypothetical protein
MTGGPLGCSAPTHIANNVDIRDLHLGSDESWGAIGASLGTYGC